MILVVPKYHDGLADVEKKLTDEKLNFTNIQIERNAGALSNFSDEQYKEAGASIVDDIWSTSGFDLKFCGTKYVPNFT